jgi:hypothetical protein
MKRINSDFYFTHVVHPSPQMQIFNNNNDLLFTWSNLRRPSNGKENMTDVYNGVALSFFATLPKKWYNALLLGIEPYKAISRNIRCENGCKIEYIAIGCGVIKKCKVCLSTL